MRSRKIGILLAFGGLAWVVSMVIGPSITIERPFTWEFGLVVGILAIGIYAAWIGQFYLSPKLISSRLSTSIFQLEPIFQFTWNGLRHSPGLHLWNVYLNGGANIIGRIKGGGTKGITIVPTDLVEHIKDIDSAVILNCDLSVHRVNPDLENGEKDFDDLPPFIQEIARRTDGYVDGKTPVWFGYEPLKDPIGSHVQNRDYKELLDQAYEEITGLKKQNSDLLDGMSNYARQAKQQSEIGLSKERKPWIRDERTIGERME